jgi:hypothetical protein
VNRSLNDPDVTLLATIAESLVEDFVPEQDPWRDSPFAWIRNKQSRTVGKIGELLVSGFLAAKGFDISRTGDSQADRLINGVRVEIKFSTLWKSGIYKFQQVRDQDYALMFCLGISPFDAHAWVLSKELLLQHAIGVLGQHGGSASRDTAWLSFPPDEPYEWMRPCGGRLRDAVSVLRGLVPR